jgi:calcium-dependent protein kinase
MVNEGEVRQLMSAIDLNRDGSLQDSEFLATMIDWPSVMRGGKDTGDGGGAAASAGSAGAAAQEEVRASDWDGYVQAAFARLDRDGDGFIDLEELLAELPPAYLSPASASASSVGESATTTASSADEQLLAEAERERVAEAKRMLREADENGDGRISREEFLNLLRHDTADHLSLYDSRLGSPSASRDEVAAAAAIAAAAAAGTATQRR